MPGSWSMRWLVLIVFGALTAFGCTADTQGETGSLSLQLVINGDTEIDEVDWTITQGEEVVKEGTINISANGAMALVEAYGLEPGEYSILMEAVSTDGETTCKGKAMFSITVGEVTEVHVMLNCKLPRRFGGVRVEGEFNLCPVLRWADASPLTTSVGNQIDLFAMATDEDDPIEAITYMWSSGSGMGIADPMAADTTYTCTAVGPDTITILVTDDGGTYCMDMHTFNVECVPADGDPCEGVICEDDGNECTMAACNPATGLCETSNVAEGTDCDGGAGMCLGGDCEPKVECTDAGQCPDDGNQCTMAACDSNTCGQSNVINGQVCDLVGTGDGVCEDGTCVAAPACTMDAQCDDGDECTVNTCSDGMCVTMPEEDGVSCDAAGSPGTCQGGVCIETVCVLDADCDDGNSCTTNTCDTSVAGGQCVDSANTGAACTVPGSGLAGTCDASGTCIADPTDPDAVTTTAELACNAAANDFGLPVERTVDPGDLGGASAQVCFSAQVPITESFILAAENALSSDFISAEISPALLNNFTPPGPLVIPMATFTATSGATGPDAVSPGPDLTQSCASQGAPAGTCPPDGNGFFLDLENFPPSGLLFIPFPEVCENYTLPASGQDICFNLKGDAVQPASDTQVGLLARTPSPFTVLPANFVCGPADPAGLGVDCTTNADCLGAGGPGTGTCELDVPCMMDADCTVNDVQMGACDMGTNLCDTAGTCTVLIIPDPNAGETCFTIP